jgi:hypothetical protein
MQTSYITNNLQGALPTVRDGSINLYGNSYNIYANGIYEVISGSVNPADILYFNVNYPASSANDGQIVIIANKSNDNTTNTIFTDLVDYPIIPQGEVWKFVSDGVAWRKVPTVGAVYTRANVSGTITLSKAGFYTTTNKAYITLPNASECDGQTTIIFNPDDTSSSSIYGGVYDLENFFSDPFFLPNYSMLKLKSVGGNWRLVKYTEA